MKLRRARPEDRLSADCYSSALYYRKYLRMTAVYFVSVALGGSLSLEELHDLISTRSVGDEANL